MFPGGRREASISHKSHKSHKIMIVSWPLVILVLVPVLGSLPRQYNQFSLDHLCGGSGAKVNVNLGKKPAVFLLTGSFQDSLECHLELRSPSKFGLYVFIDELNLNRSPNCSSDFLQFGR